ncbi:ThuA domain-containing protein, partial [Nonomuraea sp. KC401]|uniref:ThuA domain-containing protein n=1 Tax=Nonomuraea sp. KC401 TaxID=1848324 RepID=UPI00207B9FD3
MNARSVNVLVWGENRHEQTEPGVAEIYPDGMHNAVRRGIEHWLGKRASVTTATLDDPEHGLTEEVLAGTDVLTWWGHAAHGEVSDEVVDRVHRHVLAGMGLVVLHSGHFSKIFIKLMGTTCTLRWRNANDRELVWTVNPDRSQVRPPAGPQRGDQLAAEVGGAGQRVDRARVGPFGQGPRHLARGAGPHLW